MIFRRSNKTVKKTARGMDKLITGIIIGGAAASIFGMSRSNEGKKFLRKTTENSGSIAKRYWKNFGIYTVRLIEFFQKKK